MVVRTALQALTLAAAQEELEGQKAGLAEARLALDRCGGEVEEVRLMGLTSHAGLHEQELIHGPSLNHTPSMSCGCLLARQ